MGIPEQVDQWRTVHLQNLPPLLQPVNHRQGGGETRQLLLIKEGVTQGEPLAMIVYGIGVLQIIQELKAEHPLVTKLWYVGDAGEGGALPASRCTWTTLWHGYPQGGTPRI